ncbi:MAG: hypothetical protein ACYSU0_18640, partial [Planctomycetota bacterium]
MMDTNADVTGTPAPSRGEELLTGLADATLGFLVRNNLFYILSALLLLAGCFLICIPIPFGYREMWVIILLLGVINVYEAMVILTSAYIIHRLSGAARAGPVHKGAGREVSVLLVLATVLFLDGHFTVNACLTTHFGWGLLIAGVSLVLAFVKMFALSRGARFAVFGGLKAFLVPSVVFMHTVQIVLYVNRSAAPWARELSTYLAWLALGTLPMLFLLGRFDAPEGTKDATRPRWQGKLFRKIIAAVSVAIPAALLAGQTWAHDAPFSAPLLLPLLFSIIVVAPIFRRPKNARALDANRAVLAGAALIAAGLWTRGVSWSVPVFGAELVLSPFRMDMVFGAATFLVMWRRERGAAGGQRHIGYHMAFALLALAVFGHDLGSIALSIREPHFARVAPFAALAAIWWLQGRGYARALPGARRGERGSLSGNARGRGRGPCALLGARVRSILAGRGARRGDGASPEGPAPARRARRCRIPLRDGRMLRGGRAGARVPPRGPGGARRRRARRRMAVRLRDRVVPLRRGPDPARVPAAGDHARVGHGGGRRGLRPLRGRVPRDARRPHPSAGGGVGGGLPGLARSLSHAGDSPFA